MVGNKIKMKIKINKKMNEMSAMSGGAASGTVSGHVDNRRKLEESGITSDVSQNDSSGYVSEVTFDSITSGGRDYQVVQQLDILKQRIILILKDKIILKFIRWLKNVFLIV